MKEWYQKSAEEAWKEMGTGLEGLSQEEVARRLEAYGENVLEEGREKSALEVFFSQFADFLVLLLIAAAFVSMVSGNGESAAVILAVIFLNAVLGAAQHKKAEKSLSSLKALSAPLANVVRSGQKAQVPSKELAPGDLLLLEAGDLVAADGRILESHSLKVNESSLTGESADVDKQDGAIAGLAPLAERSNMVYSGSLVTYGRAVVLVTETGMSAEMGKIAALMNQAKEKETPLEASLNQFGKRLAAAVAIICIGVFGLSYYRGGGFLDSMIFAVALAVAAIPEALGSIVAIVQAMGTQKMAKERAIVKELGAVESLGRVSVICSDKTGTLTQNKMTAQQLYVGGETLEKEQLDRLDRLHQQLLYSAVLANDGKLAPGKGIGDPTELCLLEMARDIGVLDKILGEEAPRLAELPFDSERKRMTVRCSLHGAPTIFTKGAVDMMIGRVTRIQDSQGIRPITEEDKERILGQNQRFSEQGLRVLAFAYKEAGQQEELTLESENDLIFLGLISMMTHRGRSLGRR